MRAPLGLLAHARSGDKGGDANIGLWIGAEADERDAKVAWLIWLITPEEVRELLPEARDLDIEVHPLPNLSGVNVVIHGLLGDGVAASTRFDPQAKGLAEFVRSRFVEVPDGSRRSRSRISIESPSALSMTRSECGARSSRCPVRCLCA